MGDVIPISKNAPAKETEEERDARLGIRTVSFSELAAGRQCALKHQLAYRERWTRDVDGPARKGSNFHEVLKTHYLAMMALQSAQRQALQDNDDNADLGIVPWVYSSDDRDHVLAEVMAFIRDSFDEERAALMTWMYSNHLRKLGLQNEWTILAVEYAIVVWLPHPTGDDDSKFKLKTRIDLVVQDVHTSDIWLVDHKTSEKIPNQKTLQLDDQFGLYCWALRQVGKAPIGSILMWYGSKETKTGMGKDLGFVEGFKMSRSDRELDTIAVDAYKMAHMLYSWDTSLGDAPSAPHTEWCARTCSDFKDAHMAARAGLAPLRAYLLDTGFVQNFERH